MELEKSKSALVIRAATALIRKIDPKFVFPTTLYYERCVGFGIGELERLYGGLYDARIADYLAYQIYINRNSIAEGRWKAIWLFGNSSIEKYKNQFLSPNGKAGIMYYIDQWLDGFGISREIIAKALSVKKNSMKEYKDSDYEEPIKQRFYNTEAGYILCMQTTGWNPNSPSCNGCIFIDKCKESTQKRFPELYRIRQQK